jgi:uncharacterized DUF497 family protein
VGPKKAQSNRERHGIDFLDASSVLYDDFALTDLDEHSDEERYVSIGADALGRVLVVVYTLRGETVRVISARQATRSEKRTYEERRK